MRTVRNSVFETNSSSMHAIVIPKNSFFNKEPVTVCMDADMDFSDRTLIERKLPDEKASYCLHLIMKHWSDKLVCGKWSHAKKGYLNITDKEVQQNEKIIAAYRKFMSWMKACFKKRWAIDLKVKNVAISCTKQVATIEPKHWATTGCYGHVVLQNILMNYMFDTIDKMVNPDADLSFLKDTDSCTAYLCFCDVASFILDPNAVIIQNTDECDKKDYRKMQRMVIDYVKKNHGKCFVDWPYGG